MSEAFWERLSLSQMSDSQWEQLCDGCARCCLLKLEDADSGDCFYTRVSCRLLDTHNCRCSDYAKRLSRVPECLDVRKLSLAQYHWLPQSCAYRRLAEGRSLPSWHPLLSGDSDSVFAAGMSIRGFALSETYVHPEQLEQQIIELDDAD